jgi:cytochrome c peroxidase/DNA-binding beta-propeller fold protein YncE
MKAECAGSAGRTEGMRRPGLITAIGSSAVLSAGLASLAACDADVGAIRRPPPAMDVAMPRVPLEAVSRVGAGSTVALGKIGARRFAFIADEDSGQVRVVDVRNEVELPPVVLDATPGQLLITSDGRLIVALRDRGELAVLEPTSAETVSLRVAAHVGTADEPYGLAVTPDGRWLLVASAWGRQLEAIGLGDLSHRWHVEVGREARSVAVSPDGASAYVSHVSGSIVSVVDLRSKEHDVRVIRLEEESTDFDGKPRTLKWGQSFALAMSETGVFAPGVLANTGDTTVRTASSYGGTETMQMPSQVFEIALLDAHKPGARVEVGETRRRKTFANAEGCLLPRAAALDADGELLFVACTGNDVVVSFDVHPELLDMWTRARWRVGAGPTGIAIDPERREAYVFSQLDRTLTSFAVDAYHPTPDVAGGVDAPNAEEVDARTLHLGHLGARRREADDAIALGRRLFHDVGDFRISSDGRACASCHPDGRDDGLVWATPDGPRQTPMLAGRVKGTAPFGWNGARDTLAKHVTQTLVRLGGAGLDDKHMNALVAYVQSMQPPPQRAAGEKSLVEEGHGIFVSSETGCASCHTDDGTFTDGNRHDVKSRAKGDPGKAFDTPSLRFVAGTAPYFHDGRYRTLRQLLVASGGQGNVEMGHTKELTPHGLDALEAYLRTL